MARLLGVPLSEHFRGRLWVNFRSPLLWDVFAIGTYFTISLVFWYIGLIPDLATMRDRARGLAQEDLLLLQLRLDGSARTWSRYEMACVLLAAWRRRSSSPCTASSAPTSPRR